MLINTPGAVVYGRRPVEISADGLYFICRSGLAYLVIVPQGQDMVLVRPQIADIRTDVLRYEPNISKAEFAKRVSNRKGFSLRLDNFTLNPSLTP